jgi:hypothetical protein
VANHVAVQGKIKSSRLAQPPAEAEIEKQYQEIDRADRYADAIDEMARRRKSGLSWT